MEAGAWQDKAQLQQHHEQLQRELSLQVRQQQRMLEEQQVAAKEREQQLMREVRALRASLASHQHQRPCAPASRPPGLLLEGADAVVDVLPASPASKTSSSPTSSPLVVRFRATSSNPRA